MKHTLEQLFDEFHNHCTLNDNQFEQVNGMLKKIINNDLIHISDKVNDLEIKMTKNASNIEWLIKIQWFLVSTAVLTLIGVIVNTYFNFH